MNGRTEFLKMVEAIRAKPRQFDRVVSLRVDRLGRSVLDLAQLADVALQTVEGGIDSSTPTGQLVFDVLAAVASMERELIRSRTRDSLERRRTLGLRWGGQLPYGFAQAADGFHVGLDPDRAPVIREIFGLRAKGASLLAIARALNSKAKTDPAYRPTRAKMWNEKSPQVVSQILKNGDAYRPYIPDLPVVQ